MKKSLFDLIYELIIAIDNDCPTVRIFHYKTSN